MINTVTNKAVAKAEAAYADAMVGLPHHECKTCGGSGAVITMAAEVGPGGSPCPDCDGVGSIVDFPEGWNPMRAALTAALPHLGSGEAQGDLTALRKANVERQAIWCPDEVPDLSFRGNELGGETGEALNVIKKLERERLGWRGSRDTKEHLAEELADVVICADLCAITAGIDLASAVVNKFNATSDKVGIPVKLHPAPPSSGLMEEVAAALQGMLRHSCVADSAPEDKDAEDHDAERAAARAIEKIRGKE